MRRIPTDVQILSAIYDRYFDEFRNFSRENPTRAAMNYVPIDIDEIAGTLKTDPYILFGRLYYDLDKRYGYKQDNGAAVHLFAFEVGGEQHAIHFPYMAAVLADLQSERRRFRVTTIVALLSVAVAAFSLGNCVGQTPAPVAEQTQQAPSK